MATHTITISQTIPNTIAGYGDALGGIKFMHDGTHLQSVHCHCMTNYTESALRSNGFEPTVGSCPGDSTSIWHLQNYHNRIKVYIGINNGPLIEQIDRTITNIQAFHEYTLNIPLFTDPAASGAGTINWKIYRECWTDWACTDGSGNLAWTQKHIQDATLYNTFYVTPPPPPSITGPTYSSSEVDSVGGDLYYKTSTVTLTYTGTDNGGSGLAGISIDGGPLQPSPASKTYTPTGDFTSYAYAKDNANAQSGTVSKYFKKDNIKPTVSFSYSDPGTDSTYGYWETSDSSATITATISDSMSGPASFDWRISEYTLAVVGTTPTLTKVQGTWANHSGSSKQVTVDPNKIICLEIRNAKDLANNTDTTEYTSKAFMVIQSVSVTSATITPVALPTSGCNDFWEYGSPSTPQSGLVSWGDLQTSSKFKNWIASQYGMSTADVEWTLNWVEWVTSADRKGSALHAGISSTEQGVDPPSLPDHGGLGRVKGWYESCLPGGVTIYSSNHSGKNAYTVTGGGGLNGRSGGWYNGLYARGHNGSSQLTACWVGLRSAGQWFPQPVAEHLAEMGATWGLTQHAGTASTFWGIRGSGTDGGGNQHNQHRQRDDFMLWAIHSWNPGSKTPRHYPNPGGTAAVGMDKWLASAGLVPQGGGMYKIDDCIPPTINELRVKSVTVMAGNGKEYYTDYATSGHDCHFEVEATDLEYGLKHAIFTPYIDSTGGGTFTAGSPSTPVVFAGNPQGTAIAEYIINTQGHKEVYCDVEVFDMADNSSTETMAARVISIDDADPQGGPGWSGSGATTTGPTTNIQTPGLRLENIPYMVGSKPYWNSKEVDIFIEYGDEYSGIAEAKLYINGSHESTVTLPPTQTAILHAQIHHISNSNLREGINNCQLWLKDLATNEWWSATLDFYIDMTDPDAYLEFSSPQLTIRENNGKLWTKENNLNVDLYYGDPGPDPSTVDAGATGVNSIPSNLNMPLSGNQKMGHNQGGLTVGKNDIYFSVKDKVEWEEDGAGSGPMTTDKITVWVDQTKPTGSIVRNSGQYVNLYGGLEYTNTTNFNVDLQHDDADSGLF